MPELPEVETIRKALVPVLEGRCLDRVLARRSDLRRPIPSGFVERLRGRRVVSVGRRAKYLLWTLDDARTVILHLGMSGRIRVFDGEAPSLEAHDHLVFETDDGVRICLNDPRRFGLVALAEPGRLHDHPLLATLGPEPLGPKFDGDVLAARLKGRKSPIKAALLDQRVVAGIGNIYACEALFYAAISPRRRAATVIGKCAARLAAATRDVLTKAIAKGGASLRDHRQPNGELGYFQHHFAVYGRTGAACPDCDCDVAGTGGIRHLVQSGRSTFFCPHRQR